MLFILRSSAKVPRQAKKHKGETHTYEKNQWKLDPGGQMLDSADKNFREVVTHMFKELKENVFT